MKTLSLEEFAVAIAAAEVFPAGHADVWTAYPVTGGAFP